MTCSGYSAGEDRARIGHQVRLTLNSTVFTLPPLFPLGLRKIPSQHEELIPTCHNSPHSAPANQGGPSAKPDATELALPQ